MLLEIIKKGIDKVTHDELTTLYNTEKIATIKVADNELVFTQE